MFKKQSFFIFLFLISTLIMSSCTNLSDESIHKVNELKLNLFITSTDFKQYEKIPSRFTCDGLDVNPMLIIKSIPKSTKAVAVVVDDFDAPSGDFVHWVGYIKTNDSQLLIPEDTPLEVEGINDFNKKGYNGPCPPVGTRHKYYFYAYALDIIPKLPEGFKKRDLMNAIKGHIIAQGELIGEYER